MGPSVSGKPWPRLTAPVSTASADISAKIVVPKPASFAVSGSVGDTPPPYAGVSTYADVSTSELALRRSGPS